MAHGLRVWDASGNMILDTSDGVFTVVGTFAQAVSGSSYSGSFSHGDLARGTPVFFLYDVPKGSTYGESLDTYISISGTTVTWSVDASIYDSSRTGSIGFFYGYM